MKQYPAVNSISLFILFLFLNNSILHSQQSNDCLGSVTVCGNSNVDSNVSGSGTQEISYLNSCGSQEHNSLWLKVTPITSGTLGFTLKPNSSNINEDYDFFVFGPNRPCNNLGMAIRCSTTNPSQAGLTSNHTGMNGTETDATEGPSASGNSFVKWLDVNAGDTYYIAIDRPIGTSSFTLEWTGTAEFASSPSDQSSSEKPSDITTCDIIAPYSDGISSFNLETNESAILGTQSGISLTYHTSIADANQKLNPLSSPYINEDNGKVVSTIYVRMTNTTTECFEITSFNLLATPIYTTEATVNYCSNLYPETITIDAGIATENQDNYTYLWESGENTPTLNINQAGTYKVTITDKITGCIETHIVTVIEVSTATIVNVNVKDLADNNSITVEVDGTGIYEYALYYNEDDNEDEYFPYQSSNTFEHVAAGVYTLKVMDVKNNCGTTEETVYVVGFTKFFTPNGDNYHDVWRIEGIPDTFMPNTKVYIFDRYGKLIKQISPYNDGWDGTFKGQPLPSDDYWFSATLADGRHFKSHFTLKR